MGRILQFILSGLSDEKYLKVYWFKKFRHRLDLEHPVGFNEKLQWLKLHYRKPEFTAMVDKCLAKDFAARKIGEQYITRTYGVWDRWEDIDWDSLPDRFVLKTTNGGGNNGVIICHDKSSLNMRRTRIKIKAALRYNIYKAYREWAYRDIHPRIIAEELLEDHSGSSLTDYKFFCFSGKPFCILVCTDRKGHHSRKLYFDTDWNFLRITPYCASMPEGFTLKRPENLEEMTRLAGILSEGLPFIRVDFYNIDGDIRFSELTFYTNSGYGRDRFPEVDREMGDMIILPESID